MPGGFVELGEHPASAARRELLEELGLEVTLTDLLGVYLHETDLAEWRQVTVYLGSADGEPQAGDGEIAEWGWFVAPDYPRPLIADHGRRLTDWRLTQDGTAPLTVDRGQP